MNELQASWTFLKRLVIAKPELPPPPPPPETTYDIALKQVHIMADTLMNSYEKCPIWVCHAIICILLTFVFYQVFSRQQPAFAGRIRQSLFQMWPLNRKRSTVPVLERE
ncbi:hypothetical protein WDU94_007164 [Cyamophila willieti]